MGADRLFPGILRPHLHSQRRFDALHRRCRPAREIISGLTFPDDESEGLVRLLAKRVGGRRSDRESWKFALNPREAGRSRFRLARFGFATAGGSKEALVASGSTGGSANCSCLKKMQNLFGLITNHWLAKLLSLLLAVTLWAVIRSSVRETNSPFSAV